MEIRFWYSSLMRALQMTHLRPSPSVHDKPKIVSILDVFFQLFQADLFFNDYLQVIDIFLKLRV